MDPNLNASFSTSNYAYSMLDELKWHFPLSLLTLYPSNLAANSYWFKLFLFSLRDSHLIFSFSTGTSSSHLSLLEFYSRLFFFLQSTLRFIKNSRKLLTIHHEPVWAQSSLGFSCTASQPALNLILIWSPSLVLMPNLWALGTFIQRVNFRSGCRGRSKLPLTFWGFGRAFSWLVVLKARFYQIWCCCRPLQSNLKRWYHQALTFSLGWGTSCAFKRSLVIE